MRRITGFTLAEVLITLGIIGVVAALTIPTLMANANALKFRSQFKKTISTLSQAVRLNQARYDFNFADVNPPSHDCDEMATVTADKATSMAAIFNSSLSGKTFLCGVPGYYDNDKATLSAMNFTDFYEGYMYQLSDGAIFMFIHADDCHLEPGENPGSKFEYNCSGWIDVNGTSGPNKEVSCSGEVQTKFLWEEGYQECIVKNDANHLTDIYPIFYHDSIVEPATNAARYVLQTAK